MIRKKPLRWGLDEKEWNKRWPGWKHSYRATEDHGSVQVLSFELSNVYGDCGALTMYGAYYATHEGLKLVEDIASSNGFSKIFATLVGDKDQLKNQIRAFKTARWILVKKGISNRKQNKDMIDYVYVKYITNCKYKGYSGNV